MPLKEKDLIRRIRLMARSAKLPSAHGIGDDCAVVRLPKGHEALVTTDFSLEDVHFRRTWHPPGSVGHRCLARGLSDIAAMGGTPHAAFLSLALPPELPQDWVEGFISGFLKLARRHKVTLAGGDTAQSPQSVLADIVVVGSLPQGTAVLRSGARPGDSIYVTGRLGESVASLQWLRDGKKLRPSSRSRHFHPEPRLLVGHFLRENKLASAMIDISDGLSTDLGHLCEESGVGAIVDAGALPTLPGEQGLQFALHGGDDYELLFTARPSRRIPPKIAGVTLTRIGEIIRGKRMNLVRPYGATEDLQPRGWEHFA